MKYYDLSSLSSGIPLCWSLGENWLRNDTNGSLLGLPRLARECTGDHVIGDGEKGYSSDAPVGNEWDPRTLLTLRLFERLCTSMWETRRKIFRLLLRCQLVCAGRKRWALCELMAILVSSWRAFSTLRIVLDFRPISCNERQSCNVK